MLWLNVGIGSSALAYSKKAFAREVLGRGVSLTSCGAGGLVGCCDLVASRFLRSQDTAVQPYSSTWDALVEDIVQGY